MWSDFCFCWLMQELWKSLYTVYCNHLRWESFAVFADGSVTWNFLVIMPLVIMPLCNTQDYGITMNVFQWNTVISSTAKLFHLKQLAIYGNYLTIEHIWIMCLLNNFRSGITWSKSQSDGRRIVREHNAVCFSSRGTSQEMLLLLLYSVVTQITIPHHNAYIYHIMSC